MPADFVPSINTLYIRTPLNLIVPEHHCCVHQSILNRHYAFHCEVSTSDLPVACSSLHKARQPRLSSHSSLVQRLSSSRCCSRPEAFNEGVSQSWTSLTSSCFPATYVKSYSPYSCPRRCLSYGTVTPRANHAPASASSSRGA